MRSTLLVFLCAANVSQAELIRRDFTGVITSANSEIGYTPCASPGDTVAGWYQFFEDPADYDHFVDQGTSVTWIREKPWPTDEGLVGFEATVSNGCEMSQEFEIHAERQFYDGGGERYSWGVDALANVRGDTASYREALQVGSWYTMRIVPEPTSWTARCSEKA